MLTNNNDRIIKILKEIAAESSDLDSIVAHSDEDISASPHLIKSCKYSIIVISEAIANTLQHILAKKHKISVSGYTEALVKAKEYSILSEGLADRLRPFISFRNMLVHHYWVVDDQLFLENLRTGIEDFKNFVKEINELISGN